MNVRHCESESFPKILTSAGFRGCLRFPKMLTSGLLADLPRRVFGGDNGFCKPPKGRETPVERG